MNLNILAQACIFVFGMGGIWLANDPRAHIRRFGCISGLIAQPFWYYTAYTHQQWGIMAASVFYSYSWGRGFYHQWIKADERP